MHAYVRYVTWNRLQYHAFLTQKSLGEYLDGLIEGDPQLSLPATGLQPSVGSPASMDAVPPALLAQTLPTSTGSSPPSIESKVDQKPSTPTASNQ